MGSYINKPALSLGIFLFRRSSGDAVVLAQVGQVFLSRREHPQRFPLAGERSLDGKGQWMYIPLWCGAVLVCLKEQAHSSQAYVFSGNEVLWGRIT